MILHIILLDIYPHLTQSGYDLLVIQFETTYWNLDLGGSFWLYFYLLDSRLSLLLYYPWLFPFLLVHSLLLAIPLTLEGIF